MAEKGDAPRQGVYPPAKVETPSTAGRSILVIDDEPLLGQTLRLAFEGKHEVVVAANGQEGLAWLERREFDLVLCDLTMPELSGIDVYERAVAIHPTIAERFVFMTGGAFTAQTRQFLEQHAGAHIEKPFDIGDLEAMLERLARS